MIELRGICSLVVLCLCFLVTPVPLTMAEEAPVDDAKAIIGYWQCIKATYKGEPTPELEGSVHWYREDGVYEVQGIDYWGQWKYQLDQKKKPKELVATWGFSPDPDIYDLNKDRLIIRSAFDRQPLSFDCNPKGKWNDLTFKRITAAEAAAQIKKLKETADNANE